MVLGEETIAEGLFPLFSVIGEAILTAPTMPNPTPLLPPQGVALSNFLPANCYEVDFKPNSTP